MSRAIEIARSIEIDSNIAANVPLDLANSLIYDQYWPADEARKFSGCRGNDRQIRKVEQARGRRACLRLRLWLCCQAR